MRILVRLILCTAMCSLLTCTVAVAQEKPMTNQDVITLCRAGIDRSIILSKIGGSKNSFDVSVDGLIQLKQAGVPDEIVAAMVAPGNSVAGGVSTKRQRLKDELTSSFNRLKNSVVTVWSEFGHGTGFIFDSSGLILTNQHVVGPSGYIAVQFDEKRKVAATLLVSSPQMDIAILWADTSAFPDSTIAPLATAKPEEPVIEEGERVFTIGSPLNQKKIITTGIASKIEDRAIISDVNINHGNSGGPLFNSIGEVVGITTFGDFTDEGGPGISGIVRIEQAFPGIELARKQVHLRAKPSARLLPVEPTDTFPLFALKEAATANSFDEKAYSMGIDNFIVGILTPPYLSRIQTAAEREAAKEHEKRTKKEGAIKGSYRPFDGFRGWREYVGDYKPVLLIQATPELAESFWGAVGRGLAANYGIHSQAKLHFKSDFHQMKLFCGDNEVEPFQPGKIPFLKSQSDYFVRVQDASFVGLYAYPADAINASCRTVRLEIFSEKEPDKAHTKQLDRKTITRIINDFEPYLARRNL